MTQLDIQTSVVANDAHSIQSCIDSLARAFAADPATRWVWPDESTFTAVFPEFVRAFGGAAFREGAAYHVDDYSGVALWLPPGAHPDDAALAALLDRTVGPQILPQVGAVFEQMAAYHPTEPHWHLPLIGVRPEAQRRGYGAALLQAVFARCDRESTPAYLEATTPDNARLYQRLGFEPLAAIPAGPATIVPMLRRPGQ